MATVASTPALTPPMEDAELDPTTTDESNNNHDTNTNSNNNNNTEPTRTCLVCYSSLDQYVALTPCGHDEICGACHLRMRHLHGDKNCPICKTPCDQIIVDAVAAVGPANNHHRPKRFDDYPVWGNDLGPDFVYKQHQMFVQKTYWRETLEPLFQVQCQICGYDATAANAADDNYHQQTKNNNNNKKPKHKTPVRLLQDHLRNKHRRSLCQLCVDNQRDFVAQLPRLTAAQMQKHQKTGNPAEGFYGHPVCEFCKPQRFYDLTALHQHLAKEHYKCHVCEQQHDLPNQYFKNYHHLERHFDRQHFLCKDVQCLQARFVVFANELDLRHHERVVHGGTSTGSTKIQLEFRVRGSQSQTPSQERPDDSDFNYGLDGQAFVPPDLNPTTATTSNNNHNNNNTNNNNNADGDTLHPLHVQRTAQLRQQAARLRPDTTTVNAFPELQTSQQSSEQLRTGWTGQDAALQRVVGRPRPAGAVTDQDFPSLPGNNNKKKKNIINKKPNAALNRTVPAVQRQLAAMTPPSWGNPRPAASSSHNRPTAAPTNNRPTAAPTNNTANFPSLAAPSRNHFPALAAGSHRYAAAEAFARGRQASTTSVSQRPNLSNDADFPRMTTPTARAPAPMDFGRRPQAPPTPHMFPALASSTARPKHKSIALEDMKSILGQAKYKQLKNWTKDFSQSRLAPRDYVDQVATLFPSVTSVDLWNCLMSLLESCPTNSVAVQQATDYLQEKRTQAVTSASRPASSWGAARHNNNNNNNNNGANNNNKKKKKAKGNAELRQLAFG